MITNQNDGNCKSVPFHNEKRIRNLKPMLLFMGMVLFLAFGCNEKVYVQKVTMAPTGRTVEIDKKHNLAWIRFECSNPPYKRQPCFDIVVFDMAQFNQELSIGDLITYDIKVVKE
jgi:hypothetical protein